MSIEKVWQMSNVKEKYWHLVLTNDEENVRHNPSHRTVFGALIHHRALFHPKQITFISIAHSMTTYENRALSMSTLLSPCLMHSSLLPQTCGPGSQVYCQAGWQQHEWALGMKFLFTRLQGSRGFLYFLPLVRNSRWKIFAHPWEIAVTLGSLGLGTLASWRAGASGHGSLSMITFSISRCTVWRMVSLAELCLSTGWGDGCLTIARKVG